MRLLRLATVLVLLAGASSLAAAQTDPRLAAAVRSAQEGQGDSARASIQRLLDATAPTDSLYPEILYTQAMVADNAGDMRRALQRVVVEYPTSDWATTRWCGWCRWTTPPGASTRPRETSSACGRISPSLRLYAQAAYWARPDVLRPQGPRARLRVAGRRNGPRGRQPRAAEPARLPVSALRREDRERQRDPDRQRGRPDRQRRRSERRRFQPHRRLHAHPDHGAPQPTAATQGAKAKYRVQVAAVATPGAADDAADAAEKLGYPAVIVRERGLYKVRAGTFATREEAQTAVKRIKSRMGGSPFVVANP